MSTNPDLDKKIYTIYRSEKIAYDSGANGSLGSFNVKRVTFGIRIISPEYSKVVASSPFNNYIESRSAVALLKLYSQLHPSEKPHFEAKILELLLDPGMYRNLTYLSYYVLAKIGSRDEPIILALHVHRKDSHQSNEYGGTNLMSMLHHLLYFEFDSFNDEELENIDNTLTSYVVIKEQIAEIRMRNLEASLEDVNPEINTDRDKVISFWKEVLKSNAIEKQITDIEKLFLEGAFDDAKLAMCLDRARLLLIDSLKTLSVQFSSRLGVPPLTGKETDAEIRTWYKTSNIIGKHEKKLLDAIYNLSSREGSHKASTKKEYARICKNITYECIVMIIGLAPK